MATLQCNCFISTIVSFFMATEGPGDAAQRGQGGWASAQESSQLLFVETDHMEALMLKAQTKLPEENSVVSTALD